MRQVALALTTSLYGILSTTATSINQLQIGPDASQHIVRRETLRPGAAPASLVQARRINIKKNGHAPATPNVDNGSFERATLATDSHGMQTFTFKMPLDAAGTRAARTPENGAPERWEGSGDVKIVASGDTVYAGIAAPDGGIFVDLHDDNAQISQNVGDHVVGEKYMLGFYAATTPNAPQGIMEVHLGGAESTDRSAHHRVNHTLTHEDDEPDWTEALTTTFSAYAFEYKATSTDVEIIVKNGCHRDSVGLVLIDNFDISSCHGDCGDDGSGTVGRSDGAVIGAAHTIA